MLRASASPNTPSRRARIKSIHLQQPPLRTPLISYHSYSRATHVTVYVDNVTANNPEQSHAHRRLISLTTELAYILAEFHSFTPVLSPTTSAFLEWPFAKKVAILLNKSSPQIIARCERVPNGQTAFMFRCAIQMPEVASLDRERGSCGS